MNGTPKPPESRFATKYEIDPLSGCWRWIGTTLKNGYGQFKYDPYKPYFLAHRASWLINRGDIPAGMFVLHNCDNRICVNPDHLRLGTHADNMRDMALRGRAATGDQHPSRSKPECLKRGTDHGRAKLNEDQVRYIRASPKTAYRLAKELGMSSMQVMRIKRRIHWRHVA